MQSQQNSKYNQFSTKNGNKYWICALGLAWNELIHSHIKEHISIQQNDNKSQTIAHNFNNCKFTTKDIDQKSYYIKSGYGEETLKKINQQSKLKFPKKSFKDLTMKLGPHDLIAYAYLFKAITFQIPFQRNEQKSFEFEGQKVESFRAMKQKQSDQIWIKYYENKDKFMIHISDADNKDFLYLIKDKQINNVQSAVQLVNKFQTVDSHQVTKYDFFEMPVVNIDIRHQLTELTGKTISNQNLKGYKFSFVEQALKLRIDEKGAKVQQEGIFAMVGCCMPTNVPQPKYFYLDSSFWIVMKQNQKHPYLVAHIKNPTDQE